MISIHAFVSSIYPFEEKVSHSLCNDSPDSTGNTESQHAAYCEDCPYEDYCNAYTGYY